MNDKGAVVALSHGIEGFAFNRNLMKEDKSYAKVEETLNFKVIEFSKEAKKINLSHTKTWQLTPEEDQKKIEAEDKKQAKEIKKVNDNVEKTTLGDLEALQALKEKLGKTE